MAVRRPVPSTRATVVGSLVAVLALVLAGTGPAGRTAVARADTAPPAGAPATVSADALPTVQVNGVVWAQVTVGSTVYATGEFTSARPAGARAGTSETPRADLLAYDIRTGALVTSFAHSLSARGLAITASPDGSRVYVGGDFTTVDGHTRNHLAEFDTSTGALLAAAPNVGNTVRALTASASTLYLGGDFGTVDGTARAHLAAVSASSGALLSWAPRADDAGVTAMVLVPGVDRVVVGGRFTTLSGTAAYGLGSLDASTGTVAPFAANTVVRDAGVNAAITSLRTDGTRVYGTGYVYGTGGNLEGTFVADAGTGALVWVEDCHGDSYDVLPMGAVTYSIGHAHDCSRVGGFPETPTRSYHRALAFTTAATGTLAHNTVSGYSDFGGRPSPTLLTWFPNVALGTYTKQYQGAWSMTGNADYVALGGEFPSVNGTAQQGLVRFAVRAVAPNRVGPSATGLTPTLLSSENGRVRVTWSATADPDNASLTYRVVRDGGTATPVSTQTVSAPFWSLPVLGTTDTGLAPGSTHSYRVTATDPLGNAVGGASASVVVSTRAPSAYAQQVRADGAISYWRLGEAAPASGQTDTGYDSAGYDDLTVGTGVTRGVAGALQGDPDTATRFGGTAAGTAASRDTVRGPQVFTVEAWVRTTTPGEVVSYGNAASGASHSYDRALYVDATGHARFGVYTTSVQSVVSPQTVTDGAWHLLDASVSAAGTTLAVDGAVVATAATATRAQDFSGHWRVGGDTLAGWPAAPSTAYLAGDVDEVAVYPTALTAAQVAAHRRIGVTGTP